MFHALSFKNIFFIQVAIVWLISHSSLSALQERHYIQYEFTVLTQTDLFPAFSAVCESDDKLIAHYSNAERVWIRENLTDWTNAPAEPPETRDWYLDLLHTLTKCKPSAYCSYHVLQRISGCKLDEGSVNPTVFNYFGLDGEDFMSYNYDTMQWIDNSPNAKETKMKWDLEFERRKIPKDFLKNCPEWISTFNNTKKSPPDVYVFARKSPDDDSKLVLVCLATGFYPRDVEMNIRLNRINLEDQTSSGIRPNHDETFQKRISVKIDRNHEGSYDCLVTHSGLTEPVSVNWDGKCSICESESRRSIAGVIAGAVAVVLGLIALIGFCWYKRRPNEEKFFLLRRSDQILRASPDSIMIMDLQADGSERVIK